MHYRRRSIKLFGSRKLTGSSAVLLDLAPTKVESRSKLTAAKTIARFRFTCNLVTVAAQQEWLGLLLRFLPESRECQTRLRGKRIREGGDEFKIVAYFTEPFSWTLLR